jgi:ABC-2 type transport system ATP-binding protein
MGLSDRNIIEVTGLTRRFGDFVAVDSIDFDVAQGEVFGFLGANGAGKTTTIRILCGLLAPSGGRGRVLDFDIMTESEKIKPNVGYMSQRFSLYPDLSVAENLDFFGGIYGLGGRRLKSRKHWAIEMAGLGGQEKTITANLSAGFKQRLALGAALLHEPKLLFLDEPTAGVSPEARREFWDLIHELSDGGTTVFVTSHYMDEVEHCDRIVLMNRGRIAALDTPEGLKGSALDGELVYFECDTALDEVRRAFEGFDEVVDVQPFGNAFHALMSRPSDGPGIINRVATATGLSLRQVKTIEPSLEDVFIAIIGRMEA